MKLIKGSIIAVAFVAGCASLNLWAQENEGKLFEQAAQTKHQAKQIALAKVKGGKIKCVELKNVNGALIWSVDVMQSGKKDLTDVWVDARTGKITASGLRAAWRHPMPKIVRIWKSASSGVSVACASAVTVTNQFLWRKETLGHTNTFRMCSLSRHSGNTSSCNISSPTDTRCEIS